MTINNKKEYYSSMSSGNIYFLGDSTLDNIYWVSPRSQTAKKTNDLSIEGLLREQAKTKFEIHNLAYDGFTTRSLIKGDTIGAVLPPGQQKQEYMAKRASQGENVQPLKELQKKILSTPTSTHFIVLSVGGNDFRVNLGNPLALICEISKIQKRYLQIVKHIQTFNSGNVHLTFMLQYRTDANSNHYGIYPLFKKIGLFAIILHLLCIALLITGLVLALTDVLPYYASALICLGAIIGIALTRKIAPLSIIKDGILRRHLGLCLFGYLLESFYRPILKEAEKQNIPILDLPNTMNPKKKLFTSAIEPNEDGGRLIAEGIFYMMQHHDFSKTSMIYSKSDQDLTYSRSPNRPYAWTVAYPKA